MRLLNLPLLFITIGLCLGIGLGYYLPTINFIHYLFYILSSIFLLLVIGHKIASFYTAFSSLFFKISIFIVFTILGYTLLHLQDDRISTLHYTHHQNLTTDHTFVYHITEQLKPSSFYKKYKISLQQIDSDAYHGTLLLRIPRDKNIPDLVIDSSYVSFLKLAPIPSTKNPSQFNYKSYLKRQQIFHQATLNNTPIYSFLRTDLSLLDYAYKLRDHLKQKLKATHLSQETLAITYALLLGQRQDIDQKTLTTYSRAGAIHILALSGLHIGVLLFFGKFLLSFLLTFKHGKLIRVILLMIFLWSFAFLTGFSPSILRATTMFTFLMIGQYTPSRTNSFNALLTSFFILLCFNPLFLFDVGFQLSYIAVFSILWIQPLLASVYKPKSRFIRFYWDTFTVTIAAQLGLLPLSLFYFHQFPALFMLTNLVIIPLLGIILGLGLLVLLSSQFDLVSFDFLTSSYDYSIQTMNAFIHWISQQEAFLFSNITFSGKAMIIWYLVLILSISLIKRFHPKKVYALGVSLSLLLFIYTYEIHIANKEQRFIVYHQLKNSIIGIHKHRHLSILKSKEIPSSTFNYLFNNYLIEKDLTGITTKTLKNSYQFNDNTILIIDSTAVYPKHHFDILILNHSPKVNLTRLLHDITPKLVIADGSNYSSYISRWEQTCNKTKIPFHRTDKKGAFILDLKSY
ncbi:ComEC/Rec2 family competence protein [Aquimarina rhabdastrellae]